MATQILYGEGEDTMFMARINELLRDEKSIRLRGDITESTQICLKIVEYCFTEKELPHLSELIKFLAKKRGQAKNAIAEMIRYVMKMADQVESLDSKITLLTMVREVTEGKIFVEAEYARCSLSLSKMKEAAGDVDGAAKILNEVQIETYGSLDKFEKTEFILYQMNIFLKKSDFIRTQLISKKISRKNLEQEGFESHKINFYLLMIEYYIHEKELLDVTRSYKTIFDVLKKDDDRCEKICTEFDITKGEMFTRFVLYLLITSYDNEQLELMNIVQKFYFKDLEEFPVYEELIKSRLTTELIQNEEYFREQIKNHPVFSQVLNHEDHLQEFTRQIIQHNLRVMEKYYSRVHLSKMSALLKVSQDVVETELAEMVSNKSVRARINRPDGIVDFTKTTNPNSLLNDWSRDLNSLLEKVEHTCHLINKENILQA